MTVQDRVVGTPSPRVDGRAKVTGIAAYAYDRPVDDPVYAHPLQATIARGRVAAIDDVAAAGVKGVLAVVTHRDAARLADTEDAELSVLQSDEVAFRGQFIGVVLAETPEIARHAAGLVRVEYDEEPHDTELRADRTDLYAPEQVNGGFATDTDEGDVDAAMAAAAVTVDEIYTTPMEHNNPMEPHSTVAIWNPGGGFPEAPRLTLFDSTQSVHSVRSTLARVFGLRPEQVRVVSPYVGGGFGSKGMAHAHNVLAVLAARAVAGRPVKLALTRHQMFSLAGHRTPTIQRVRLGADEAGRMTAVAHEAVEHTSKIKEFAEQTAVGTRMMYAAPNRRTSHRVAALDVPVPSWMRAPGEAPGFFGLEVAMDELAAACGLDPIELRARNDPRSDPESGRPWSGRHLVRCLREGAARFGWEDRPVVPGTRRRGRELVGMGVASSTYPYYRFPGSRAVVAYGGRGRYTVRIGAADIGTGAWTVLTQIAADALGCPLGAVSVEIGDSGLPSATVAGGSSGTTSWGSTIVAACRSFRRVYGDDPPPGAEAGDDMPENPDAERYSMHSFGAQFAEVRVDADTGEIRVPRMLGVFSVGRVINPRTARSQFIGGMTMGLSMALLERSVLDHRTGHVINHDFAEYLIATNADVMDVDAVWLDEEDVHAGPLGARGIGEIGIVGAAAAIANAVHNATGIRVRDLPITPDLLLR